MTTVILNKDKSESEEFQFRGDLCISAKGKGSIQILRKMENDFIPVTDIKGNVLEFASDGGLAVNSTITCNVRRPYKIKANGDMMVTYYVEK